MLPETALGDANGARLHAESSPHEEHIVYQIFDAKGRMRLRSYEAPDSPLDKRAEDGVRDIDGWHVLTLVREDGRRRVAVAETIQHRREDVAHAGLARRHCSCCCPRPPWPWH